MLVTRLVTLWCVLVMVWGVPNKRRRRRKDSSNQDDEVVFDNEMLTEKIQILEDTLATVSRQLMMQQFYVEEQTRSSGHSGIVGMRHTKFGTRPYYSASHADHRIASIHDHANTIRTIGMGEFTAVINGVAFRTRHNDYSLVQKSRTSSEYGATEEIPFPGVPPEVTQHLSVDDQVTEMKEWFKAWANQDDSVRNYKDYFKPVLCYLEGMWTNSDQSTIEESFESERHFLDANSWLDLQDKIRFTSYSGTKDGLENYAYLPTTVFSLLNGTIPVLAQWNFKILCHPLKKDLPLNRLNLIDDFKTRISRGQNLKDFGNSRAARFQLSPTDSDKFSDQASWYSYLDDLMGEIPGADNYQGSLVDKLMGDIVYPYDTNKKEPLNVSYFHRTYRVKRAGAMGLNFRRRGFSDENLFVAQTENPKVVGLPIEKCNNRGTDCQEYYQRWTYAIPLEMIYLTPLSTWNPYNIDYKGASNKREGKTVYEGPDGKRNGEEHPDKAFNGTNSKVYYLTPLEFFMNTEITDPADTTQDYTCVLDSGGNMRRVRASGYRTHFPEIPGIGTLRQRYPMMPIHGEGNSVWKELAAVEDMIRNPSKYRYLYNDEFPITGSNQASGSCVNVNNMCDSQKPNPAPTPTPAPDTGDMGDSSEDNYIEGMPLHFMLQPASGQYESHTHHIELSPDQAKLYMAGERLEVITEEANGHSHQLNIARLKRPPNGKLVDIARRCDGKMWCWDGHHRRLVAVLD